MPKGMVFVFTKLGKYIKIIKRVFFMRGVFYGRKVSRGL